ncbi:MAG TPA: glycosyltransferase family 4 protein, partial [Caldilineaceae bacterium]|nr:glycosyltransferase family 4 protein [Caldilineaceae bacterium]
MANRIDPITVQRMRLGIANQETWGFFNDIYADLTQQYQTSLFRRRTWQLPVFHDRVNQYLFRADLQTFMRANDVVFFEWASELLAGATRLPKACGVVTRLHRYEMYQWVNRINWEAVDKIILVSQAKKREFTARFPEQASKIVVSGPSTSLEKFTPQPKAFGGDIGILCHLTPRKRVYDLILSFYELTQKQRGLHLHIAGGADPAFEDYYRALHHLVNELKLQEKVTFYGNVAEPWLWYPKIDIFISNSYSEGLQVAPMEAMASGCYCLSHRWEGAEELLP